MRTDKDLDIYFSFLSWWTMAANWSKWSKQRIVWLWLPLNPVRRFLNTKNKIKIIIIIRNQQNRNLKYGAGQQRRKMKIWIFTRIMKLQKAEKFISWWSEADYKIHYKFDANFNTEHNCSMGHQHEGPWTFYPWIWIFFFISWISVWIFFHFINFWDGFWSWFIFKMLKQAH